MVRKYALGAALLGISAVALILFQSLYLSEPPPWFPYSKATKGIPTESPEPNHRLDAPLPSDSFRQEGEGSDEIVAWNGELVSRLQHNVPYCRDSCCVTLRPLHEYPHTPFQPSTNLTIDPFARNDDLEREFYRHPYWYYRGEPDMEPGLHDRINFKDGKAMSELVYGRLPKSSPVERYHPDVLPCLLPGTSVSVELFYINQWIENAHNDVTVPYLLTTGDSDLPAEPQDYPKFFGDKDAPNAVMHWYAHNCAFERTSTLPRFTCQPIGVSQWTDQREILARLWGEGVGLKVSNGKKVGMPVKKEVKVLVSMSPYSNPAERWPVVLAACGNETGHAPPTWLDPSGKPFGQCLSTSIEEFDRLVYEEYPFVASPHGAGLDCYRTWETLLLGGYPIVKKSTLDPLYQGLPVLIVEQWSDVTYDLLRHTMDVFQHMTFNYEKLYMGWWQRDLWARRPKGLREVKLEYSVRVNGTYTRLWDLHDNDIPDVW